MVRYYLDGNNYRMDYNSFPCNILSRKECMTVKLLNGEKRNLTQEEYVNINDKFGEMMNFRPLIKKKVIHKRLQ